MTIKIEGQWWRNAAIFLAACLVIASRRPDAVLHAQFYAEDGRIWFAEAYNGHWWQALFAPYNGYLNFIARLAAVAELLVPIALAPLVGNLLAIAVQALPVNLLLMQRSAVWGPVKARAGMALIYLVLPNTGAMIGTITETQWTLALCAFLLLVARPPLSGKAFDVSTLLLCGLSGPFCLFLLPVAAVLFRVRKSRWYLTPIAILGASSLVQIIALMTHNRNHPPLGTAGEIVRILASQIYLGTILGSNAFGLVLSMPVAASIAVIGTGILSIAVFRGSTELRLLVAFCFIILAASLASPILPNYSIDPWMAMAGMPSAHYWFLPCIAFAWALISCLRSPRQSLQVASGFLLFVMVMVGVVRDWRYPAFKDLHFATYARQMEALPHPSALVIPENPDGWRMELIKR